MPAPRCARRPPPRARTGLFIAFALAAACVATPALATLYKWTDANGRIVYSDQPPIGVKAEVIGAPPPRANPNAAKDLATKEAEFKKRQQDRAEEAVKADKAQADAAKKKDFCSQAKAQVAGLSQTQVAVYRLNEKGDRILMDDAQRKSEIERLEKLMKEQNCPR